MRTINNKKQHPTSTVLQSRFAMFLPVEKLSQNFENVTIRIENKRGLIVLESCKLTQVHRNIVDCIFSFYEPKILSDGSAVFTFSKYGLLKKLNHKHGRNGKWLEKKFEEMRRASIQLRINNEEEESIDYQGVIYRHKLTKLKNEKNEDLYGVIFSQNFMMLFEKDLNIYSQKLTEDIIDLPSAVTQALVREIISHKQVNRSLEKILGDIGVCYCDDENTKKEDRKENQISKRAYRYKIEDVLALKETLLEKFGIDIKEIRSGDDKGTLGVFYKQHKDVHITNPRPKANLSKETQKSEVI